jgi:hypothetical protein
MQKSMDNATKKKELDDLKAKFGLNKEKEGTNA